MTRTPQSGTQFSLRAAGYEAEIASVGASLRVLRHEGRDLVVPFDADELRPAHRGATLAPWPNRIVDARYSFDGATHELPVTERARGHALHGLTSWLGYEAVEESASRVVLRGVVEPQTGYPWRVEVEVTFALDADGLTQTVRATNLSETRAPFGTAAHPYLVGGPGRVDDWSLELPAGQVLNVTADRLVPTEIAPVEEDAPRFDFRASRALGAVEIDHAFTGLQADAAGLVTVRVTAQDGTGTAITWDEGCPWVQVHTADLNGDRSAVGYRVGLAVEPMTCAPDAFNSGAGLRVIEPGNSTSAWWRLSALS